MQSKKAKSAAYGVLIGVGICLVIAAILPIHIVYEVPVTSISYPARQWSIIQENGAYRTTEQNFTNESASDAASYVFERGDVINIAFQPQLAEGATVAKEEMLLQFSSMMHNLRIQRALNEISIQRSLFDAGSAAFKRPLVDRASEGLALAEANLELQKANHSRLAALVESGIVSQAELDGQTNRLAVAQQEVRIAQRNIEDASFESKPEDLAVFETRIGTTDKELDLLLAQQSTYQVKSPFEGVVKMNPTEGVLLTVQDTSRLTLIFPFPIADKEIVSSSSTLTLETDNGTRTYPFILRSEVATISGQQQCVGVAMVDDEDFDLGQQIKASVVCDSLILRDYLLRKLL